MAAARVVGYGKLGRSWNLNPSAGTVGCGDVDVYQALRRLAYLHPDVEWRLVGRNSGERPGVVGLPANVSNPWTDLSIPNAGDATPPEQVTAIRLLHDKLTVPLIAGCDDLVLWLGQHGTHNSEIPLLDGSGLTTPQWSFLNYARYVIDGVNAWRDVDPMSREEIWLCPDPRNYLKPRDLKWPAGPIVAQFNQERTTRHYRYGDPTDPDPDGWPDVHWYRKSHPDVGVWEAPSDYRYGALELTTIPSPVAIKADETHSGRVPFGIALNENKPGDYKNSRLNELRTWVLEHEPDTPIYGKWSARSLEVLGRDIQPIPYPELFPALRRWLCTLTTPASGSGWATAKPWECFAVGTACFFHPGYDTQDHVLRDAPAGLRDWLRVPDPDQLWKRVKHLTANPVDWQWLVRAQREHFENRFTETHGGVLEIERRLELA